MSDGAKVEIEVVRPGNPLAPPPHVDIEVSQSELDGILFKLPEWLDDEETAPSASQPQCAVTVSPIQTRVGIAKPPSQGARPRITRTDLAPTPGAEATPERGADAPAGTPTPEPPAKQKSLARSPQERVRNLSMAEAQKVARTGEQGDRVALERLYGKAVWETLLHNSRLTPPEVLRIARMASLPVPLLELIVGNRAWLSSPQVRRALLANRRLTKDMIATVLRATPKSELRLMQKQTAYPPAVREAAAKLFK